MGLPVGEMLRRISSEELSEWTVYESEVGPVGPEWDRQLARDTNFQLRALLFYYVGSKLEKGKPNPVPPPKPFPLPQEMLKHQSDGEDE